MKTTSFSLSLVLCSAAASVWSCCASAQPAPHQNAPLQASETGISLAALLQLQPSQRERLTRLYEAFDARRLAQDSKITREQTGLLSEQGSEAKLVVRRQGEIARARRKVAADFEATRMQARAVLPPVQRSQLDSLASDPRFRVRRDFLYELLLAPSSELFEPQASDVEARRNWLDARRLSGANTRNRARDTASYGVYGGYDYGGPQLGVYSGYRRGAVGVHAGVGLGGPSVGVSIGRVFGIGRR